MHGLLALSAMHYGQSHPDERAKYDLMSSHYQNLALQVYTTRLHTINMENFEPYFFLATFIFIISMCSIADPQHLGDTITPRDIGQSFSLLQGIKSITEFKPMETWSPEGPLGPFKEDVEAIHLKRDGPFQARMEQLYQLARELSPSLDVINVQSSCLLAIESLRTTHASCSPDVPPAVRARRIWLWPMSLTQFFVDLICDDHHVALIILAHYAALVRPFEHPKWMNRGWSDRALVSVEKHLDEDWRQWIEWPKQCLIRRIEVDDMDS